MKEKILQSLKTKYSNLGLSDELLGSFAESLSKFVTKDEEIDNAISGVESTLKSFQSQFDKMRSEKSATQKELDELKKTQVEIKPTDPPKDENKPLTKEDIAALIKEQLAPVTERISETDKQAKEAERLQQILSKAKDNGIPEAVAKYMNVPESADIDEYMKKAKQDFSDNGFSEVTPPESAEAQIKSESENIANMIQQGTKEIVEKEKTKN